MDLKRNQLIALGIILIIILILIFVPKKLNKGEKTVKYKVLESSEIPEKIKEVLPKYLSEERAMSLRLNDEIYVLVMRGEKSTSGYTVDVEKIVKDEKTEKEFGVVVHAKFKDPDPNDIVAQSFTYPFAIVKTNLKQMPDSIKLEVEYGE